MTANRQRPEEALRDGMNRPPDPMAPIGGEILEAGPPRWEYLTRILQEQADISGYGEEGWELVSVTSHGFNEATYYFKRQKA